MLAWKRNSTSIKKEKWKDEEGRIGGLWMILRAKWHLRFRADTGSHAGLRSIREIRWWSWARLPPKKCTFQWRSPGHPWPSRQPPGRTAAKWTGPKRRLRPTAANGPSVIKTVGKHRNRHSFQCWHWLRALDCFYLRNVQKINRSIHAAAHQGGTGGSRVNLSACCKSITSAGSTGPWFIFLLSFFSSPPPPTLFLSISYLTQTTNFLSQSHGCCGWQEQVVQSGSSSGGQR